MAIRLTETETTRNVQTLFDMARKTNRAGLITGPAGTGKTSALKMLTQSHPETVFMMTFDTTTRTVTGFLSEMVRLFSLNTRHRSERDLNLAVRDAFERKDIGFSSVFVIDEAQHADERTLRHILTFNEDFGLAIILAGNEEVLKRTRSSTAAFAQIETRISFRLELKGPTVADVQAFCVEYNVDYRDQQKLIPYGVRMTARDLCLFLSTARTFVGSGPIKLAHIANAIGMTRGHERRHEFLELVGA